MIKKNDTIVNWISDNIEYYLVSDVMSSEELLEISNDFNESQSSKALSLIVFTLSGKIIDSTLLTFSNAETPIESKSLSVGFTNVNEVISSQLNFSYLVIHPYPFSFNVLLYTIFPNK